MGDHYFCYKQKFLKKNTEGKAIKLELSDPFLEITIYRERETCRSSLISARYIMYVVSVLSFGCSLLTSYMCVCQGDGQFFKPRGFFGGIEYPHLSHPSLFSSHGFNALLLPGAKLPFGPVLHILATSETCSRNLAN
jgi:hypothetical protein